MNVFNNHSPKFWTWLICLSFACILVFAAAITNTLRNNQFQTRYDNLYHKELRAIELAQTELTQQALMTAHLIKKNQLVEQLLGEAADLYSNPVAASDLKQVREKLHDVIQPYWLYLQQQGVKQLHFHLAPNAYTLYRAHRPEFHSDILAEVRPMVMTTISTGKEVSGIEVGRHGVGLRAALPVIANGKTVAAVEVGYGLAGALALNQNVNSPKGSADAGMALAYSKNVLEVVSGDFRAQLSVDKDAAWVSENDFLSNTRLLSSIPGKIQKPMLSLVKHGERRVLLTLVPWYQFGKSSSDADVILVSWQDVSVMYQQKMHNDLLLNLIWLVTLIFGVFFVYFIRGC